MKYLKLTSVLCITTISATLWLVACSKNESGSNLSKAADPAKTAKIASSAVFPSNANMFGKPYSEWGKEWLKWVYNVNCALVNAGTGTAVSSNIHPNVYFMTCPCFGSNQSVTVPVGKSLLFPIGWYLNDFPCSNDPEFHPAPGETIEHFLIEGAKTGIDPFDSISIDLDGVKITDLMDYRVTNYFNFTGNPDMTECWDPCITGASQPGAMDGFWYMMKPMSIGTHVLKTRAYYHGYGVTEETTYTIVVQ